MSGKHKTKSEGQSAPSKRGRRSVQDKGFKAPPQVERPQTELPKSPLKVGRSKVQKTLPRVIRQCGVCQGQVAQLALYCRHCGKPLSADVPPNPHLPAPPRPWRPSRIPRHRPSAPTPFVSPSLVVDEGQINQTPPSGAGPEPVTDPGEVRQVKVVDQPSGQAPKPPTTVEPEPDPLWAPIPEIEARLADLRALHERLRPMLARSGGVKSRIRSV